MDPKDAQIIDLIVVAQKFVDNYKKSSDKPNMESTKRDTSHIRYLPP